MITDTDFLFQDEIISHLVRKHPDAVMAALSDVERLKPSNLDYAPYNRDVQRAYEETRAFIIEHEKIFPPTYETILKRKMGYKLNV